MIMTSRVLVLGATGGQGAAVTAALLKRGADVRAMVRDPGSARATELARAGVELVAGSFTDARSLRAAMTGMSAVFALTTPFESGPAAETAQGMAMIAVAVSTRVPFLVFSSVAGALSGSGVPHFDSKAAIERELSKQQVPHAVLAPTFFYDNLTGQVLGSDRTTLSLPLPASRPLQQLDRATYGHVAAEVLLNPDAWVGQRLEVAADSPTGEQMAAALSRAGDRSVRYLPDPLTAAGPVGSDMRAMWTFLNEVGYQVDLAALHARFPNVMWTSFAQWAAGLLHPAGTYA